MKLTFEPTYSHTETGVSDLSLVHFYNNKVQIFFIENNKIFTKIGELTNNGDWSTVKYIFKRELLEESGKITFLNIDGFFEDVIIGSYIVDGIQKMFKYQY